MDSSVQEARHAAVEVLRYNAVGPCEGLPRTAGWGYPEPYTRDLLISALGILTTQDPVLMDSLRRVLETLAKNQSPRGQITSLVHDPEDRGASDTTPLFLVVLGLFQRCTSDPAYLDEAMNKALLWMDYQTIDDRELVGQQPTSDWRDEHWVLGHGLYVNALVHGYLKILGLKDRAEALQRAANQGGGKGFVIEDRPTYSLWFYKVLRDDRCDLLGNSLAILTGLASPERAHAMVRWIESSCEQMRARGDLALDLPPCFFPFVQPTDRDWHPRYERYNLPGHYHNGGVWPFVCGFYVAALVAIGELALAEKRLGALTELVRPFRLPRAVPPAAFGFNEWFGARSGCPSGEDWQTWSAAMYLYAAACVEGGRALFF